MVGVHLTKLDILKKLSPGTALREGLEDILRAKDGVLIVIDTEGVDKVFEGGFKVNCKFTSRRLAELSKMDGAIIISEDFKKILYANTLLVPNRGVSSIETGTRHQAAERTAKQTGALTIAVSERRGKITVYYRNTRFILKSTMELLRRTTETLQILEKQREVLAELLNNLNILEITNFVSIGDVCSILQRIEMIKKMSDIINEHIISLGREGVIVRMRMKELTRGILRDEELIVKDYGIREIAVKNFYALGFEGLLDEKNIAHVLFEQEIDKPLFPRGFRILDKTSLSNNQINHLTEKISNLNELYDIGEDKFLDLFGDEGKSMKQEINRIKEQILSGKRI